MESEYSTCSAGVGVYAGVGVTSNASAVCVAAKFGEAIVGLPDAARDVKTTLNTNTMALNASTPSMMLKTILRTGLRRGLGGGKLGCEGYHG